MALFQLSAETKSTVFPAHQFVTAPQQWFQMNTGRLRRLEEGS